MASLKSFIPRGNASLIENLGKAPTKNKLQKSRDTIIAGVDRTLAQIKAGEDSPKRGWYRKANDEYYIASVRAGRSLMSIEGNERIAIKHDQLVDFYKAVREEVAAGRLDKEIEQAYASAAKPTKKG